MTNQTNQADTVLHKDQLRTVLVNALTGAFGAARVHNKRDTASSVLAEFRGLVDGFDVTALSVDSEFDDGTCLTLLQAHTHAYVVPVIAWGEEIQQELSESSLLSTTAQDPTRRLLFVVRSLLMQNATIFCGHTQGSRLVSPVQLPLSVICYMESKSRGVKTARVIACRPELVPADASALQAKRHLFKTAIIT